MIEKLRIEGRKKRIQGFRHETDVLKVLCLVLCRTLSTELQLSSKCSTTCLLWRKRPRQSLGCQHKDVGPFEC